MGFPVAWNLARSLGRSQALRQAIVLSPLLKWLQVQRRGAGADIAGHKGLIMRNHGLLVVGRTAAEAFGRIYMLERACEIQIAALSGGRELVVPSPAVQAHTGAQANPEGLADWEELAWNSALRLIAGDKPDYRD